MSRWRDVKHGKTKITDNRLKKQKLNFCNATLVSRFKAFVTDAFMILMPLMYLVFYVILGSGDEFSHNKILGWTYIFIPHFIIMLSFWYIKGQSPGLKAYELSIVNSNTGLRPTLISLIIRYLITTISLIFIFPFFIVFLHPNKKTLHDIISNTCIKITPNT